jgi:hypothetical protein
MWQGFASEVLPAESAIWGPLKIIFSRSKARSSSSSPPALVAAVNELLVPILDSCLSLL